MRVKPHAVLLRLVSGLPETRAQPFLAPLNAVIQLALEQQEATAPFGRLQSGQVGEPEAA